MKVLNKEFSNLQNKLKRSLNSSTNSINLNADEKTILSANNSPKYQKLNLFNSNIKNSKIKSLKRYKNNFNGLSYKFNNIIKKNIIINGSMSNKKKDFHTLRKNDSMEINNIKIYSNSNYLDKIDNKNRKMFQRGKSSILLRKNLDLNKNEQQEKKNINELKSMFDQIILDLDKS